MCNIEDFKFLAEMIQHVPLPLRARYVFCCAPINRKMPFVCSMFLKVNFNYKISFKYLLNCFYFQIARQYSRGEPLTFEFITKNCGWPFSLPKTIIDLVHLESVFDVMDLYLWLSYRFMDQFPDAASVRAAQKELDEIIQQGVFQITRLLKNTEANQGVHDGDTSYNMRRIVQTKGMIYNHKRNQISNSKIITSLEPRIPSTSRGRLTDRLIAQGLLTPGMLSELRKEWDAQQQSSASKQHQHTSNQLDKSNDSDDDDDSALHKKMRRKRKK